MSVCFSSKGEMAKKASLQKIEIISLIGRKSAPCQDGVEEMNWANSIAIGEDDDYVKNQSRNSGEGLNTSKHAKWQNIPIDFALHNS